MVSSKDHSKGPLWVGLSRVRVHQAQVTIKCDVSFEFSRLEGKSVAEGLGDISGEF